MKDVLSQTEIDALLQGLVSGEVTAEQIEEDTVHQKMKSYDFRQPNKFSKEHLLTLQVLHEGYARLLTNFLSGLLNANIDIEVASVGQFTYEEFARSVVSPTLLTIFNFSEHKGNAIVETNAQFLRPLIDLQMGGEGEMPDQVPELTEIEMSVARKIIEKMLNQLNIVWKDIFKGTPAIVAMETNPHLHQLLSPSDIVLVITFSTSVEENKGLLNLCLSYNFLETVLPKFATNQFSQAFHDREHDDISALEYWVKSSMVEMSVLVGQGKVTVKEFLELQLGDVLILDRQQGQDFELLVQDQLKFKAQPGRTSLKLAVQVTSLAEEGLST